MANCMKNIAEGLGVGLNEVFCIDTNSDYYRITEDGLEIDVSDDSLECIHDWRRAPDQTLLLLIWGEIEITKLRWKPGYGEDYFVPDILSYSNFSIIRWYDTEYNKMHYDRGIVFRTEKEAIDMAKDSISTMGIKR